MRYGAWLLVAAILFLAGSSWAQTDAKPEAEDAAKEGANPHPSGFGSGLEADALLASMLTMIRSHYQGRIQGLEKDPVMADRVRAELIQAEFRIAAARLLVRAERFEDAAAELRGFIKESAGPRPIPAEAAAMPKETPRQAAGAQLDDGPPAVRVPVAVSVSGQGYFRVLYPTGEEAYAQSGRLALDEHGRLLFQSGTVEQAQGFLPMLPVIVIDKPLFRMIVNRDGSIQIKSPDGTTPFAGQIELAVFPHGADDLVPGDSGLLFRAPTGAAPEYYTPGPGSPAGSVVHGAPK